MNFRTTNSVAVAAVVVVAAGLIVNFSINGQAAQTHEECLAATSMQWCAPPNSPSDFTPWCTSTSISCIFSAANQEQQKNNCNAMSGRKWCPGSNGAGICRWVTDYCPPTADLITKSNCEAQGRIWCVGSGVSFEYGFCAPTDTNCTGGAAVKPAPAPIVAPPTSVPAQNIPTTPETTSTLPASPTTSTPLTESTPTPFVSLPTASNTSTQQTTTSTVTEQTKVVSYAQPAPFESTSRLRIAVPASVLEAGTLVRIPIQFQNNADVALKLKFTAEFINEKGKTAAAAASVQTVEAQTTLATTLEPALSRQLPPGEYELKVKIIAVATNEILEENSFPVTIEKFKPKYFVFTDAPEGVGDLVFDPASLLKIKSDVRLPLALRLKYVYTHTNETEETVKIVREIVNESDEAVKTTTTRWSVRVRKKITTSVLQLIPQTIPAGSYVLRIRVYDDESAELLTENSFGFNVTTK